MGYHRAEQGVAIGGRILQNALGNAFTLVNYLLTNREMGEGGQQMPNVPNVRVENERFYMIHDDGRKEAVQSGRYHGDTVEFDLPTSIPDDATQVRLILLSRAGGHCTSVLCEQRIMSIDIVAPNIQTGDGAAAAEEEEIQVVVDAHTSFAQGSQPQNAWSCNDSTFWLKLGENARRIRIINSSSFGNGNGSYTLFADAYKQREVIG